MNDQNQTRAQPNNHILGFLSGLLMGGLAGAGAALLLAPQSGKDTRDQLQNKGIELRTQASKTIEPAKDAVAQIHVKSRRVTSDMRKMGEELEKYGEQIIDGRVEHSTPVVEAG